MIKTNPEVFKLYTSTVMDTHKPKPPIKSLIILAAAALVAVLGIGYGVKFVLGLTHPEAKEVEQVTSQAVVQAAAQPIPDNGFLPDVESKPVWTEQTIKPRIPSQPHTAPVYDQLTTPTDFPRVAACMSSETRGTCDCYTQQATPIDVPHSACLVYIKHGSFDPWLTGRRGQMSQVVERSGNAPAQVTPHVSPRGSGVPVNVVADTSSISLRNEGAIPRRP